jgi:hypothetical protein
VQFSAFLPARVDFASATPAIFSRPDELRIAAQHFLPAGSAGRCIFSSREAIPLKSVGFIFRFVVCAALFSAVAALAQQSATTQSGPVPPAILSAKKVFVSYAGDGGGLFPKLFSGNPNRVYTQFYATLKTANQFELVADPSEADLVLELHLDVPIARFWGEGKDVEFATAPEFVFRLEIYDRKTHYILWTIDQSIGWADLQKNRDRNFDGAMVVLMEKFQQLAGKPITPFR